MADYRLCLPAGWNLVERDDRAHGLQVCNREDWQECGFLPSLVPGPGAIYLTVVPSDRGYGSYESREGILTEARITGQPPPDIRDVALKHLGDGIELKCWVARELLAGDVWRDTYTLTVGGRRFRVSAFYNDEGPNVESFRAVVQGGRSGRPRRPRAATRLILSSVTPTGGTGR